MTYVDQGPIDAGTVCVFLHGNPTSSYLWRNVIPEITDSARAVAPDLIGMGDSDKLKPSGPDRYTFAEHRQYLDAWFDSVLPEERLTLVLHDWGSALGFDWAYRNQHRIHGIVYMEALVMPITWDDWPKRATPVFQGFRSEAGEKMILEENLFIEGVLPTSIIRTLSETEMNEYRRPFKQAGEDRRPTLSWPRQIPLNEEPEDVVALVRDYGQWLETSPIPKLFIDADPGAILRGRARDYCQTWANQSQIQVAGIHFIQEDSGPEIGRGIADWLKSI